MAFFDYTDVKLELNIAKHVAEYDELLNIMSVAVLDLFDQKTGRTWASSSYEEKHNADGYTKRFQLDNYPVTEVTAVYDDPDRDFTSDTLLDTNDYTYDPDAGILYTEYPLTKSFRGVRIDYTAGYTDSNFPSSFKRILVRQAAHWYNQATNQKWDLLSQVNPGAGGTLNYGGLEDNLLPEFYILIQQHRSIGAY